MSKLATIVMSDHLAQLKLRGYLPVFSLVIDTHP